MNRLIVIIKLSLLFTLLTKAQYSTSVFFTNLPEKNTYIGSFIFEGTNYVSFNDLAKVLKFDLYINNQAKKVEAKTGKFTIKITANNSYVIVGDENDQTSIFQLKKQIYFSNNSFFVPAKYFIPILDRFISENILFDETKKSITISKPSIVSRYDIHNISYEQKANGTILRLHSSKKLTDYESWVKYDPNDKEKRNGWLYLTVANARANIDALKKVKPSGIVKDLLIFPSPASVQFTFKLNGIISSTEILQSTEGNDLIINIFNPTEEQIAEKKIRSYEKNLEREKDRWKLDVIVIDPGHGGKDPGAIGVTNTKEKDVALAVALKLGQLIEKNFKDIKVVYTRKKDEFVELYKRGQIANQANGKLFMSLHCNSTPRKPNSANGFEVYLLRPGKNEHALKIAERENSVIKFEEDYEKRYQELTQENFILLTMAQSAYIKYSEQFAEISTKEVGGHTELINHGVKQAGFYVLVGASMPNVLVEMGYLSNKNDEKFLKSSKGQQKIAEALFQAIKKYKVEYEKSLEEVKSAGVSN